MTRYSAPAETLGSEMTGIDHDLRLFNGLPPSPARCSESP